MRKLASLSILACALAACGSDDKSTRGEIHLASIVPKTGVFGNLYQLAGGAMALAAKTINDAGGILGKDVVFDEYDEASGTNGVQPQTDLANLLAAGDTQVWIGPYLSDSAIAMGPIAGDAQRLMITTIAGARSFATIDDHDFAFRGLESPYISATGSAVGAIQDGARTAAVLHLNFATGTDLGGLFATKFAELGGTVQVNHGYDYSAATAATFNAQAQLDTVFAGNPDVIYFYGSSADAVAVLTAWNKSDWNGQWILGVVLGTPELAAAVGTAKMNGVQFYGAVDADPAEQAVVIDGFAALNGFTVSGTNTGILNSIVNSCYLAALAIEKAGEYDGVKARDALRDIANAPGEQVVAAADFKRAITIVRDGRDLDFLGLTSSVEYDANGDFPANLAKRSFNAAGGIDYVRTLVYGVDF